MNVFEFTSFIVEPNEFRILKRGHMIKVELQVFEALLLLIEKRHRVVTKDELLEKIWQGRIVSNHVITRIIYQLRKILDSKKEGNSHIRTVRGKGYQFVAEVTETAKLKTVVNSGDSFSVSVMSPWITYKSILAFFSLALISLVLIGHYALQSFSSDVTSSRLNAVIYPVVSVLPIEVEVGNEEMSILVQSLIDYLTHQLTVNLNVKVIHPDSLVNTNIQMSNIWDIQQATRSDFIIQGFVESVTEESIKLHLRLYKKTATGEMLLFPLGAFEFPYPKNIKVLNDLYKQRKVTVRSVVNIIKPGIIINNEGDFETDDPAAYRLVISAHHMSRSDDCKDMQRAEQLLLRAIEKDNEFVYAYLQLFTNYYKRVWICGKSTDFHQKGLAMAEAIDRLAPGIYKAMSSRRSTILVESNQVEQAYELTGNADLNNPHTIYDKSYSLRYAGFLDANSQNLDRILQLDPFFFNEKPIQHAPNTMLYLNRFEEHLALLAEPGNSYHDYFRGLNLYLTNKTDQAASVLQGVVMRTPDDLFGQFSQALLHVINNDGPNALKTIDSIVLLRQKNKHTDGEMTYKLVQLYALVGAKEQALTHLQKAVDQGFFPMNYFLNDPAIKAIQNTPQFLNIVKQATSRHESFAKKFGLRSETMVVSTLK